MADLRACQRAGDHRQHAHLGFSAIARSQGRDGLASLPQTERAECLDLLGLWLKALRLENPQAQVHLQGLRHALHFLVEALGAEPASWLARALGLPKGSKADEPACWPSWQQRKFSLLGDVLLLPAARWTEWASLQPEDAAVFAVSALHEYGMSDERHARWQELAEAIADHPGLLPLPLQALNACQAAAFHAAYMSSPRKHACKAQLVAWMRATLLKALPALEARPASRPMRPRPRLLIVGEQLAHGHAMLRCYADALASLRARFEVLLLAEAESRCSEHNTLADACHYFPANRWDLHGLIRTVRQLDPDVILFPSVGMAPWTFAAAALRLAPLQLAGLGHPGPACSPAIDGTVVFAPMAPDTPDPGYGAVLVCTELPLPSGLPEDALAEARQSAGSSTRPPAPLLGINASAVKLNARFLGDLEAIVRKAPKGTRLRFFPNMAYTAGEAVAARLRARFPDADVRPQQGALDYALALAQCSAVVQTYPFGGTNTTIDALALGVPVVCLESEGIEGAVDPLLVRAAGYPGDVLATREALIEHVAALLGSAADRPARPPFNLPAVARVDTATPSTFADQVWLAWTATAARMGSPST
ncbi:MAG: hypothetical protein RL227_467 [Pseudomonadota bacterium]